jgi:predicted acetyltransferase
LLPESAHGRAVLALCGGAAIGHGVWRQLGATSVAEIGVVVTHSHQRKGVGSDIVELLISDLRAHGMRHVEVFTGGDNRAVHRMLSARVPTAMRHHDRGTMTFRFPTEAYRCKSVA